MVVVYVGFGFNGFVVRWFCSKYFKKGKRYFISLVREGCVEVKKDFFKLRWMRINIETWIKNVVRDEGRGGWVGFGIGGVGER